MVFAVESFIMHIRFEGIVRPIIYYREFYNLKSKSLGSGGEVRREKLYRNF